MEFKKGQIRRYEFPTRKNEQDSKVLKGLHPAVILFERETPYNTYQIAPITKASALKGRDSVPDNYLLLLKENYPLILKEDSYVNLDMSVAVDKKKIQDFPNPFNGGALNIGLSKEDLLELDLKLITTYEMEKTVAKITESHLEEEVLNIIEHVDSDFRSRLKNDHEDFGEKVDFEVDRLIESLKKNYIKR